MIDTPIPATPQSNQQSAANGLEAESSILITIARDVVRTLEGDLQWQNQFTGYAFNLKRFSTRKAVYDLDEVILSRAAFKQFCEQLQLDHQVLSFRGIYTAEVLNAGVPADRRVITLKT